MNKIDLRNGKSEELLKELENNSVDSIVTDPPYELGFMGKSWDNSGIANNVELWKECLRVLKPGGHLLSFSGTRTYHRMATAIEDAGFEVRDMIEWVYGSGFPKSLNIGKAVDKLQGNEREVTGVSPHFCAGRMVDNFGVAGEGITGQRDRTLTKGTSEYEGWGTALKPAHEPICMARKPLAEKTVAENCLKWGTGGINIDESRVGTDTITQHGRKAKDGGGWENHWHNDLEKGKQWEGRFPANLVHDNSEEVRECFPETGKSTGGSGEKFNIENRNAYDKSSLRPQPKYGEFGLGFGDSGNASRFFKSIIYQAKASKSERNKGCEGLEEKNMTNYGSIKKSEGRTGINTPQSNNHPTVKPIALMEYLIKMVTPKGGTVLDPFMGSGSTGCAAVQNGFGFIGIDMTPEYVEIAKVRIKHYSTILKQQKLI